MPGVVCKPHVCSWQKTGHGCFPPRPSASASPNVFVNGLNIVRYSDGMMPHCCNKKCHGGTHVGGSSVFVNGKPLQRIGHPISCGSTCAQGSTNVFSA